MGFRQGLIQPFCPRTWFLSALPAFILRLHATGFTVRCSGLSPRGRKQLQQLRPLNPQPGEERTSPLGAPMEDRGTSTLKLLVSHLLGMSQVPIPEPSRLAEGCDVLIATGWSGGDVNLT